MQYTQEQLKLNEILSLHQLWLNGDKEKGKRAILSGADLCGANLSGTNLSCADLCGANLYGADLCGADLYGADLCGADLYGADLSRANLSGANLSRADLSSANLSGADLYGAILSGANLSDESILPTGETWKKYKEIVVPYLLQAGGKKLSEFNKECWDCHTWENCPMAEAFNVKDISLIPLYHKPRVEQFIQLFDAKLLPNPFA